METQNLTDEDRTHIARLQALRRSGSVNMFTELKKGLDMMLEPDRAEATYEWVQNNFEYYTSGEWRDVNINQA